MLIFKDFAKINLFVSRMARFSYSQKLSRVLESLMKNERLLHFICEWLAIAWKRRSYWRISLLYDYVMVLQSDLSSLPSAFPVLLSYLQEKTYKFVILKVLKCKWFLLQIFSNRFFQRFNFFENAVFKKYWKEIN